MPHGCSLSLHETSCNEMHMPHELTPKWTGLEFSDTSISTAQCMFVRHTARWGRTDICHLSKGTSVRKVTGLSSKCLQLLPWTVSSDFHYIFTCSLCCLSAAPGIHLGVVRVHKSEYCQLLPIWIPKTNIIRFRCIRKIMWSHFQQSLPNFCHGYQGEKITQRSQ